MTSKQMGLRSVSHQPRDSWSKRDVPGELLTHVAAPATSLGGRESGLGASALRQRRHRLTSRDVRGVSEEKRPS